jgi:hypothetical protein
MSQTDNYPNGFSSTGVSPTAALAELRKQKEKPKVDKEALDKSIKSHEKAVKTGQIVRK